MRPIFSFKSITNKLEEAKSEGRNLSLFGPVTGPAAVGKGAWRRSDSGRPSALPPGCQSCPSCSWLPWSPASLVWPRCPLPTQLGSLSSLQPRPRPLLSAALSGWAGSRPGLPDRLGPGPSLGVPGVGDTGPPQVLQEGCFKPVRLHHHPRPVSPFFS